jgi:orotate phosphoribosyltransferase
MNEKESKQELMKQLFKIGAVKFGEFTLKSGKKSPYYIDLRVLSAYPTVLRHVGRLMGEIVFTSPGKPDILCGIPSAGLAIANAMSLEFNVPTVYTKKEPIIYKDLAMHLRKLEESSSTLDKPGLWKAIDIVEALSGMKTHGLPRYVEGDFCDGAKIGIIDDLITTAESKLEARDLILMDAKRRNIAINVVGVYVILDREQGGREALELQGLRLYSIATISETVRWLYEYGILTREMHDTILEYTLSERRLMGLEVA